jgi:Endonuclease/Exonuclease/phosphatase family
MMRWLILLLLPCAAAAGPDRVRVATFNTELQRDGPGLMLRDIRRDKDPQIAAVVEVIRQTAPDVLALQGIDWDYENQGLNALVERIEEAGLIYPYRLALRPNSGMASQFDLDGDGRLGGPGDSQGYGSFSGQGGLAVLSRYPINTDAVRDLSPLLWQALPGAVLPTDRGGPFPSIEAQAAQRLSSTAHWIVPIDLPSGPLHLMTFQAAPPVFDGPEDRNGLRNRDEIRLWRVLMDGQLGPAPSTRFVIAGGANLDPWDSDGQSEAIRSLLADPRLQDPAPQSKGAAQANDQGHKTPNALDTVEWDSAGRLRVDYVLPSSDWTIMDSGVFWPASNDPGHEIALQASRHRLVWVDLRLD